MRYKISKNILLFICLFVCIGALFGSICMFIDPTGKLLGMDTILIYFNVLPYSNILFNNYIFLGISLLIVNGITNLIASYLIVKNNKTGIILGIIFGFTLVLWIIIQFIILPKNSMSIAFFIIGIIQIIIGYATYVFYLQNNYYVDYTKYKNINKNKDILVVYFSRMGYTKKIAYDYANEVGAFILKLNTLENTSGTLGFWWCGRYGLLKRGMAINDINISIESYKKVVIVSPIWVFNLAAPVLEFINRCGSKINKVEYVLTHFMDCKFINVADKMDNILNKKRDNFTSYCIRFGNVVKKYEL